MAMSSADLYRIADFMTELENYPELSLRVEVLELDNETVRNVIVKAAGSGEKASLT